MYTVLPVQDQTFGNENILQVVNVVRRNAEELLTVSFITIWDLCECMFM